MSITRQVTIWCDGCQEWEQATTNAAKLRRDLRKDGWAYSAGDDYCPRCAKRFGLAKPQKKRANDADEMETKEPG